MSLLIGFLIVAEILVSILLILVILVQPSKSGGLGGAAFGGGGGMGEQLFGARTGNVMTKATVILASVFLLNTLLLAFLYSQRDPVAASISASPAVTADEQGGGSMQGGGVPDAPSDASSDASSDATGGEAADDSSASESVSDQVDETSPVIIDNAEPPPSADESLPSPDDL